MFHSFFTTKQVMKWVLHAQCAGNDCFPCFEGSGGSTPNSRIAKPAFTRLTYKADVGMSIMQWHFRLHHLGLTD